MKSDHNNGKRIALSDRLSAVAAMVTIGNRVCDVGCDHGFVSIYLALKGASPKIIAMDIKEGPLQAARDHIEDFGLTDYIETRLSNGVEALKADEADTLICAGMGGRLMIKILEEGGAKVKAMKELILQPQSDVRKLREYLRGKGYIIADENMILEEGKYYPMIQSYPKGIVRGKGEDAPRMQRIEDKYGPVLLQKRNPVLYSFLLYEKKIYGQILNNLKSGADKRLKSRRIEVLSDIEDIETALSFYL